MPSKSQVRINLDEPRWDQSTYWGRARHFFATTNPLNLLKTSAELERAKDIVTRYQRGENVNLSADEIWRAKHVYDSAYHPETGEKMFIIGRMSAQVPCNMFITGSMMSFYKSRSAVIFWQWFNQSFNALVNYTNRSGTSPITVPQLATSYVLATGGALATALTLKNMAAKGPPILGRLVPFVAVAAANCVNIPIMRMGEVTDGIPIYDEHDKVLGNSTTAAKIGIAMVVLSRIGMAVPGMTIPPVIMNTLEKKGILTKYPRFGTPFQILLTGFLLTFATPMCCALFPQKSSLAVTSLEPELQERIKRTNSSVKYVYYNKGL